MSVQQFWNLSQLLGVFTCRKLANLCQNFVTETSKQRSETTRRRLCCEKLGTSHHVEGFAIGSFLERIVVERAEKPIDLLRNLPENNHKFRRFFTDCFPAKFALKIPTKSTDFSVILSPKIRWNLTFFLRIIRSPVYIRKSIGYGS